MKSIKILILGTFISLIGCLSGLFFGIPYFLITVFGISIMFYASFLASKNK